VSREGTLLDDENNVVLSAFQDDQVICRIFARIGVAVARPVGADGTQAAPFKAVKWTT
jgi:thiazole synthase ThiGH ThiG subunit